MQARFKFRFWDKKHNKMYYEVQYGLYALNFSDLLENEDYELMQCTGLKDQNGKPIYENDIIFNNCGQFIIKFCDKCKSFQCFDDKYGCYSCLGDYMWAEFLEDLERTEVIGNIYKNPELLNKIEEK